MGVVIHALHHRFFEIGDATHLLAEHAFEAVVSKLMQVIKTNMTGRPQSG